MSEMKLKSIQLGTNATAANNVELTSPSRFYVKGATGDEILEVDQNNVFFVSRSGVEGGQIDLEVGDTSTLGGTIHIDQVSTYFRIFGGPTSNGVYVNMTQCAAGAVSKLYHMGNVTGTVSMSGTRVTGNIIEYGSNANGKYFKFADGRAIAFLTVSPPWTTSIVRSFPLTFSSVPTIVGTPFYPINSFYAFRVLTETTTTYQCIVSDDNDVLSGAVEASVIIVGRWYE